MRALIAAAQNSVRPAPPAPAWSWGDAARATWAVYAQAAKDAGASRDAPHAPFRRRPAGGVGA